MRSRAVIPHVGLAGRHQNPNPGRVLRIEGLLAIVEDEHAVESAELQAVCGRELVFVET